MIDAIQRYVLEHWEDRLGLPGPRPRALSTLQLSSSAGRRYSHGSVLHLLFAPGGAAPVLCAKFRWDRAGAHPLEREERALDLVAPRLDAGAPRSYGLHQIAGRRALLQSVAPGRPMSRALGLAYAGLAEDWTTTEATARCHAAHAAALLGRLWEQPPHGAGCRQLPRLDIATIVQRYIADVEPEGESADRAAGLGETAQRLVSAVGPRLFHGDFQPYNLFIDGEHTTLIDWEHAACGDAWFLDPCRYAYYALLILIDLGAVPTPEGPGAAFDATFLACDNWFAPIVGDFLLACLRPAVGTARDILPLLGVSLMYACLVRRDCEYPEDYGFTALFREHILHCAMAYAEERDLRNTPLVPPLAPERAQLARADFNTAEFRRLQRLLDEQTTWNVALRRDAEEMQQVIQRLRQRPLERALWWAGKLRRS